jgi:hypothetical protein
MIDNFKNYFNEEYHPEKALKILNFEEISNKNDL